MYIKFPYLNICASFEIPIGISAIFIILSSNTAGVLVEKDYIVTLGGQSIVH